MIRTGSIGLDIALGGGWTVGTLNEIWGDSGSGKTTVALHTAESVVRSHQNVLWVDLVDGVAHMDNPPKGIIGRPRNAEDVFWMARLATEDASIALVVIDSAERLVRQIELDGDLTYAPHPQREFKDELTGLKRAAKMSGTTVLFVSQPRDKQREPIRGTGISEKVFMRVHLHPDVIHQDGSREIVASVKDVPGKTVQHAVAKFTIRPGRGIDQARELVQEAAQWTVGPRSGRWYHWPEGVSAHGLHEMTAELRKRPHMMDGVDEQIRAFAGIA